MWYVRDKKGFTLIELMISVAIIGILIAAAAASFVQAQRKARDGRRMQDMEALQKAAEQYYLIKNDYLVPIGSGVSWYTNNQSVLENFPKDPKIVGGVGWTDYSTISSVGTTGYCFCALMENPIGNALTFGCNFQTSGDKYYYCVKNKQ